MPPSRTSRKRSRKRHPNFVVLKVNASFSLLTLAANVAVKADLIALSDDVEIISSRLTYSLRGATAGEGPLQVGLAKSAYSEAQIVEAMDASPSSRSDDIQLERTKRKVRNVGSFSGQDADEVLNDGKPIFTRKMYWKLANADDLVVWVINRSAATLTTGTNIVVNGEVYARWT